VAEVRAVTIRWEAACRLVSLTVGPPLSGSACDFGAKSIIIWIADVPLNVA
jgi:hypothetical protein